MTNLTNHRRREHQVTQSGQSEKSSGTVFISPEIFHSENASGIRR